MIISKKKLNEMLKEREEKIREEYMREERFRENERWNSARFNDLEKRMYVLEEKLNKHMGISLEGKCEVTTKPL